MTPANRRGSNMGIKVIGGVAAAMILVQLAIYAGIGYVIYAILSHFNIV